MTMDYYMYKCQPFELDSIIDNLRYADRSIWESQRILGLFIAQKNVKKKIKIEEVFKLPWDEDDSEVLDMEKYMKAVSKLQETLNNKLNEDNEDKIQEEGT